MCRSMRSSLYSVMNVGSSIANISLETRSVMRTKMVVMTVRTSHRNTFGAEGELQVYTRLLQGWELFHSSKRTNRLEFIAFHVVQELYRTEAIYQHETIQFYSPCKSNAVAVPIFCRTSPFNIAHGKDRHSICSCVR